MEDDEITHPIVVASKTNGVLSTNPAIASANSSSQPEGCPEFPIVVASKTNAVLLTNPAVASANSSSQPEGFQEFQLDESVERLSVPNELDVSDLLGFRRLSEGVREVKEIQEDQTTRLDRIEKNQERLQTTLDGILELLKEMRSSQSQTTTDVEQIRRNTVKTRPNVEPSLYARYGIVNNLPIRTQADMIKINDMLLNPPDQNFFQFLVSIFDIASFVFCSRISLIFIQFCSWNI
jgi:hypothetical protein